MSKLSDWWTKRRKQSASNDKTDNPFKDVKLLHQDMGEFDKISVAVEATQDLDAFALKEVFAQIISFELAKTDSITISSSKDDDSSEYFGTIIVLKHCFGLDHWPTEEEIEALK